MSTAINSIDDLADALAQALHRGDEETFDRLSKENGISPVVQISLLKSLLFSFAATLKAQPPTPAMLGNIEHRVKGLEQQSHSHVRWRGAWRTDQGCDKNDFVIHGGALWIAQQTKQHSPEPGTDQGVVWTLANGQYSPTHEVKLATLEACDRDLANRVGRLEKQSMRYEGTWDAAKSYAAGACVTDRGGIWHANAGSRAVRPGGGDGVWTLAVKSGKDAR